MLRNQLFGICVLLFSLLSTSSFAIDSGAVSMTCKTPQGEQVFKIAGNQFYNGDRGIFPIDGNAVKETKKNVITLVIIKDKMALVYDFNEKAIFKVIVENNKGKKERFAECYKEEVNILGEWQDTSSPMKTTIIVEKDGKCTFSSIIAGNRESTDCSWNTKSSTVKLSYGDDMADDNFNIVAEGDKLSLEDVNNSQLGFDFSRVSNNEISADKMNDTLGQTKIKGCYQSYFQKNKSGKTVNYLVFPRNGGKPFGIFIEVMLQITRPLSLKVEMIEEKFPVCLEKLKNGEIDFVPVATGKKQRLKYSICITHKLEKNSCSLLISKKSKFSSPLWIKKFESKTPSVQVWKKILKTKFRSSNDHDWTPIPPKED
jgi:hypothetical protein